MGTVVTGGHLRLCGRRILSVAICYAIVFQAFLAAFETTLAVGGTQDGALIICHGADPTSPPAGNSGNSEKYPCVFCAAAACATALLPGSAVVTATPHSPAGRLCFANVTTNPPHAPARAGYSRAPPSFV
jgi:hypothetical protein